MKRFLSLILIFILLLTSLPMAAWAEKYPQPTIVVEDMNIPTIDPGKKKTITLNLKAIGNSAYDVVVTPEFTEPITSDNFTTRISLGNININKTVPLKLEIKASQDALPANYPIKLNFSYSYYNGDKIVPAVQTESAIVYVRVSDRSSTPKLLITEANTNPKVILPGQDFRLNILYQNKGTMDANDLKVRIEGLSSSGFYITSGSDLRYVNRARGGAISSLNYDLRAAQNIASGTHELEVVFEHSGQVERQKIYLVVGGSEASPNLIMENLEYPTSGLGPNKDFVINFDLINDGALAAKNIIVKAESTDPAILPRTNNIVNLGTINAGESKNVSFSFFATEDAENRNYPIQISVEYEDELNKDEKYTLNQYVGMYVEEGPDAGMGGKPKLIIDKYSFEPQLVKAGENFKMNLSFYNTNSSKTVKNIKIFLTAEPGSTTDGSGGGSAFTPVESSNTFYIDSIPPKGRVEKTITMFVVPDAIAKTHTITANFEYEDSEGNELKDIELIGVPVVQQSKLDTGEVGVFPEAYVGESTPVSIEFYNTGKVTLYNLMVKLEGDFQTESGQYYVGNFESGSSDYFEGYVIPAQAGPLEGQIVFTYEDSTGQIQEVRKDFSLNVMEMPVFEDPWGGEMPPMVEKPAGIGGFLKSKGWIIAALIIALGITFFYRRKKKLKEEELTLDE